MKITLNVGTIFCYDCVLALRKFIGSMKGVGSVEVEEGKVAIDFDPSVISEKDVIRLARDSVEKLGYRILE
jgi:copper chaperone CopZ